jgi:hypothetical protein
MEPREQEPRRGNGATAEIVGHLQILLSLWDDLTKNAKDDGQPEGFTLVSKEKLKAFGDSFSELDQNCFDDEWCDEDYDDGLERY